MTKDLMHKHLLVRRQRGRRACLPKKSSSPQVLKRKSQQEERVGAKKKYGDAGKLKT